MPLRRCNPSNDASLAFRTIITHVLCGRLYVYDPANQGTDAYRKGFPRGSWRASALCAPNFHYSPLHAVLLIGWKDGYYELLDPYFPGYGQPLRISDDDFAGCFAGHAAEAGR